MLDTAMPVSEFAETVQKIYDFQTDGLPVAESLSLILHEVKAVGGALQLLGRDGSLIRHLAGSRPTQEGSALAEFTVSAATRNQSGRYELTLWRQASAPFARNETALAQDLLRHFARARDLVQRIESQSTEARIYGSVLDRLAVGAIFIDARGMILRSAGIAAALLRKREGLREFRGAVAAVGGTCDRRLQTALRAALDPADPTGAGLQSLVVQRPDGLHGLGLVIQRLANAAGEAQAVILIRDPQRGGEPEKTMLRSLFDLTPAEAELARSLTAGFSLDESAAALSISRNTARAHLRAIFSKSGITRQTELMRLMLNSAAMFGAQDLSAA